MRKLFAMLLTLIMSFQLIVPAWADVAVEVTESTAAAEESGEDIGGEEPSEEMTETVEELTTVPMETSPEETMDLMKSEKYRVTFICTPGNLALVVYSADADTDYAIPPEENGSYQLEAGEYVYLATAEGYLTEEKTFAVEENCEMEVSLKPVDENDAESSTHETVLASGKCGENVNWVLTENGTLTISGSGKMENYDQYIDERSNISSTAPWNALREKISNVVVESGIENIGSFAFDNYKSLESVYISAGVTSIGDGAFMDCRSLINISIPEGVTKIAYRAFMQSGIASIYIPKTVQTIEEEAFFGCEALRNVYYGGSVEDWWTMNIGSNNDSLWMDNTIHYYDRSHMCKLLQIPSKAATCSEDGNDTYYICEICQNVYKDGNGTQITTVGLVTIPALGHNLIKADAADSAYAAMGDNEYRACLRCGKVFKGDEATTETTEEVKKQEQITVIASGSCGKNLSWTLDDAYNLVVVGSGDMKDYGIYYTDRAPWYKWGNQIKNVTLPDGLTSIGQFSFYDCKGLSNISIPEGVISVGNRAFSGCNNVTDITIPKSVRSIGNGAFSGCSMETIYIPEGVESIGESAFMGCGLTKIELPNTLTSMGKDTFWFCGKLKEVKIPGSLKIVPDGAFRECGNIRQVTLEEGIEELGCELFESSSGITKLVIPASVHKIGYGLVSGKSTVRLEYHGTMREWAEMLPNMPAYCSDGYMMDGGACGDFDVSNGEKVKWFITQFGTKYVLTIFGNGAIGDHTDADDVRWAKYRKNIEEVIVEEGVDRIGECAFWGCAGLKKITLPESMECVSQYAFSWCHGLKEIVIPKNVNTIGYQAFYDCYNLTAISFLQNVDSSLDIIEEAFITNGRTVSTTIRVEDTKKINPAISNFNWAGNRRRVTYGYLNCLERAEKITLLLNGQPVTGNIAEDMSKLSSLSLEAKIVPDGALQSIQWSSSAKEIATVGDGGVVTLMKPGTTVISAATVDGSKLIAKVTLSVTYVDAAKTLKIQCDGPSAGLELGKSARLTVSGENVIPEEYLQFSIAPSHQAIASVDENGIVTAGNQTGTVTITAELKSDPLKRKTVFKLNVIPKQIQSLRIAIPDTGDWGTFAEDDSGATLTMDASVVRDRGQQIPLLLEAQDDEGNWNQTELVSYAVSDSSIASVSADGVLTVKRLAVGQCVIRIQSKDLLKAETQLRIVVEDKSPRLDACGLAMNSSLFEGCRIALVESYGNTIQQVWVSDDRFVGSYKDGYLQIRSSKVLKNGDYNPTLGVVCADGRTYTYPLTIKVTNSLPKVTVKQEGKLNLFYRNDAATLNVTVPNQTITNMELTGTDDFVLDQNGDQLFIRCADPENISAKPNTKAVLNVYLEGYQTPVKVNLTIATVTTAPAVKLSAASSTLNTTLNKVMQTRVTLLDKSGQPLALEAPVVISSANGHVTVAGNQVTITLNEAKGATVTFEIQDSSWARPVKLTHRISVSAKLPTLKPASNLTLNSLFAQRIVETGMVLSQSNLSLAKVELMPAAKVGTAARTESDKLRVVYDPADGHITAEIANPAELPKNGSYSFTCIGVLETGETIPGGTLKVTVAAAAPKVKLSATSLKLNRYLAKAEKGSVNVNVDAGYQVTGFKGLPGNLSYDASTGVLTAVLRSNTDVGGTYTLYPVIRDLLTDEEVTLPTKLTFKIQSYESGKLGVSLSVKGKLDTQQPSELLYTVNKLTNCLGAVDDVTLDGQDADLFRANLDNINGKTIVRLNMLEGKTYATNKAYKVQFRFRACGVDILSTVQTVRVSQTATKVTVPKTITYYQAQESPLRCVLAANVPLESIELNPKTAKEFLEALGEMRVDGDRVEFEITNPAVLMAGKSYSVLLNITPENNAENVKPITVKLTVKVMK